MLTTTDKLKPFAKLVAQMRAKQKEYFDTRSHVSLDAAKKLERAVDRWLVEYADGQTRMFQ